VPKKPERTKMPLKEIILPYSRKRINVQIGNCFGMTFVYPKPPHESFLVKGGVKDIESYINLNMENIPAVLHHVTYLNSRRTHKYCEIINMGKLRLRREIPNRYTWNRRYYYLIQLGAPKILHIKEFRKIPRGWIKELDPYVPTPRPKPLGVDFDWMT
jgi:hypothetical protein